MNILKKNKKLPKVIINDKELEKKIGNWLGVKKNIVNSFSKLLLNVGFDLEDEITLYKNYYVEDEYLSFSYIVNGKNPYKKNVIMLEYGKDDKKSNISVYTGSKNTRSKIVYEVDNDSCKVISKTYDDKRYGMINRRYYDDSALFFIEKGNYELCLFVSKPNNIVLNGDLIYRLKNEKELVNYLDSLVFPINIDLVYKKICEISLGDTSIYPEFSLKVNKFDNIEGFEEVIDEISLENGFVNSFIITRNDRTIRIDGMDDSWIYENRVNGKVMFVSFNSEDNSFKHIIISDKELNNKDVYVGINQDDVRESVMNEVLETKKLVKVMFERNDKYYV